MSDDPRLDWSLANPFGIVIDAAAETWWSGRVFDLVELDGGDSGVLLGTETGGMWIVDAANDALPLSNSWTNPNINCVAVGPDGPRHFFAAGVGGVIYETDASHATPLLQWAPISDALPADAGDVYDIVVLRRHRLILAACSGGLYWSAIPETPPWWCVLKQLPPNSGARPPYHWTRADEEKLGQSGYFCLAVASLTGRTELAGEEALGGISVIAGAFGQGVFFARWSGGTFVLKRSRAFFNGDDLTELLFGLTTGPSSVASCEGFPLNGYAACALSDGRLQMILRSKDGGRTFAMTENDVKVDGEDRDIRVQAGDQGAGGAPNNCIAVDPSAPGVVAFGWQDGTFVSPNAGKSWIRVGGDVHHPDVHVLLFKRPTPDDKHLLYIGSDGGLAQVNVGDVIGGLPVLARSDYNRQLATLQFYSTWVTRQFSARPARRPMGTEKSAPGFTITATSTAS
jgi:photosystem II stability/assembly factor-like uncharacterized protein